ncbi:MAG TPA: hypothetical protein VKH44_13760, partial [Pirellulaceae bacterium]|nr:hypothetical protein [Pirellulaceae bacterium]
MSIAEAPLNPVPAVTDPCAITEHAIRLRNVPWEAYAALREPELNNHVRMTYDCGDLEIMSPSGKHAKVSSLIGFMIYEWAMLREIAMDFGGDMTLKRVDLSRGLEADECYWMANTEVIRGKD